MQPALFPSVRKCAWVTLLTRGTYLAGTVLLAYSLHKKKSRYPLIILYTSTLPTSILPALKHEAKLTNAMLVHTEMLHPKDKMNLIADRFGDTWTKLRVFELLEWDRLCFLDADMLVFRNMDEIFDIALPEPKAGERGGGSWLVANHVCVCNLDSDSWAPKDWTEENCAFTGLTHPEAMTKPCPATESGTKSLLNSGLFLFEPSKELLDGVVEFFNTTPLLKTFLFPDQDFLAEFFKGRWISVGWQYNALKTWRYWHPEMWRDDEVRNLHYIVDKPWNKRIGEDGKAGYLGNDGETHRWWWDEYERWQATRENMEENEVLDMMRAHVASTSEDQ